MGDVHLGEKFAEAFACVEETRAALRSRLNLRCVLRLADLSEVRVHLKVEHMSAERIAEGLATFDGSFAFIPSLDGFKGLENHHRGGGMAHIQQQNMLPFEKSSLGRPESRELAPVGGDETVCARRKEDLRGGDARHGTAVEEVHFVGLGGVRRDGDGEGQGLGGIDFLTTSGECGDVHSNETCEREVPLLSAVTHRHLNLLLLLSLSSFPL